MPPGDPEKRTGSVFFLGDQPKSYCGQTRQPGTLLEPCFSHREPVGSGSTAVSDRRQKHARCQDRISTSPSRAMLADHLLHLRRCLLYQIQGLDQAYANVAVGVVAE
jgi:hypothetical protein